MLSQPGGLLLYSRVENSSIGTAVSDPICQIPNIKRLGLETKKPDWDISINNIWHGLVFVFQFITLPPHHLLVEGDCLQLSINIILIIIFGRIGKWSNLDLTLCDSAHVVILDGDPVHQRSKDLILDLLDAAMLIKVFGVGHHCSGDDLRRGKDKLTNSTAFLLIRI